MFQTWSGLPCPSPGDLSNPGIEPMSPVWQVDPFNAEPSGKPRYFVTIGQFWNAESFPLYTDLAKTRLTGCVIDKGMSMAVFHLVKKMKLLVIQSGLTLCEAMDCSLPGSSVHWIHQARILDYVAILFSRGSSWPRDREWVSCIAGRFFTTWATREAHLSINFHLKISTFKFI